MKKRQITIRRGAEKSTFTVLSQLDEDDWMRLTHEPDTSVRLISTKVPELSDFSRLTDLSATATQKAFDIKDSDPEGADWLRNYADTLEGHMLRYSR
ncbi:hypothetical protein ACFL2C_04125 [Patescibacteria group bacterium]